jgi:hypothetical protein
MGGDRREAKSGEMKRRIRKKVISSAECNPNMETFVKALLLPLVLVLVCSRFVNQIGYSWMSVTKVFWPRY